MAMSAVVSVMNGLDCDQGRAAGRGDLPLKGVVLLFIRCFGFKAAILAVLGQAVYQDRVGKACRGAPTIEQAGAMGDAKADPSDSVFCRTIKPYLR